MPNQALALHRVADRVYDLTGLRTGSIRDQLLRASLVSNSLVDDNQISAGASDLLVVGAGAAGMCVAMSAAYRGVNVTVIERLGDPFATFHRARWRRVDPCEYDWPHEHCGMGAFPRSNGWFPLPQQTGSGAKLARDWAVLWKHWKRHMDGQAGNGHIDFIGGTPGQAHMDPDNHDYNGSRTSIRVNAAWGPLASPSPKPFGAIVNCAGFGRERTDNKQFVPDPWHGYQGPAFWLDNDKVKPAPALLPYKRVVISGGGDGAMQDFQRVVAGRFGLELLQHISKTILKHQPGLNVEAADAVRRVQAAEDAGRRAHAWQREKQPANTMLRTWHLEFEAVVNDLLAALPPESARKIARDVFRKEFLEDKCEAVWVYADPTPGYAYALNRYVCLLLQGLARADNRLKQNIQVLPEFEIESVIPSAKAGAHQCLGVRGCLGVPHDVKLRSKTDRAQITMPETTLIVVRHGANRTTIPGRGALIPEQMTPFDIPV